MRKRLMILALVLIAVLMTCTLAACSSGGGRCSGGHTWDEGTVKEAATCTESGTLINKCTVCGIKREVAIEALGHDLQTIPGTVIEPTCEEDGYAGKKACVREGCEYVLDTGTIIPAIGHAYGDWTSNGDGTHKRVCSNDSNHVESGNCSGGTADCGHKAVCDVCGGEYGDFASSHVFDKQVTTDAYKATDATCEAKATYYYSCQCGEKGTETFEYGDYADHVFDREVADAEYLVSVATCTSPAIYNKSCACGLEGTETFEYGDALPHTFDKQVATDAYMATDATCTAKATYYYSCDCGAHGTATFAYGDMLAHVYDKEVAEDKYLASAATCEKKATYYKSCYCGHFDADVSATFESGELGDHVYDNKVVSDTYKATDATCTEKATYYFSCDCGKAGTETFENGETLPHVYDKEVTEDKYLKFAANCASAAVYYKSCACGHFDTETSPTFYFGAPSGNHVYDREVATDDYKATDATCTAKATYYFSCECGEKGTTTFEAGATLDHTMTHHAAVDATCISTGNVEYWTCSTCSLNYDSATGGNVVDDVTTAIDSTNHVHRETTAPAVDPSCENTGLTEEISCADCGIVLQERESIPALGHKGGTATCKDKAVCEVCGEAYGELANHTPGEIEVENNVAPSCTAEGSYDNVIYCSVCDHELSRETITVDKVAHTGGTATCVEQATCSVCGEKYGDLADHSWNEGVVTTPATCTTEGVKTFTCTVDGCGETRTETIEKSAHNFVDNVCEDCQATVSYVDKTIVFTFGENGNATHKDGSPEKATYTETKDGYTLSISGGSKMYPGSFDAKGNSALKLGTGSVAGSFEFTVPADVTEVVIHVAQYKANTTKISVNGVAYTITTASNNGEYTEVKVDTTTYKKVSFTTVSGGYRCMINTIEFKVSAENICSHENREVDEVVAPTCTVAGHTTYVCPDCDHVFDADFVDATGHTLVSIPAVAPTCENTGLTEGEKCSVCDHVTIEQTIVDMLPCVDGDNDEHCDNCHKPMCEHIYGDWTYASADTHNHVCTLCGKEEIAGHDYEVTSHVDATCEEAGSTKYACADCGHEYTETHVALGHNEAPHDAKDPTCSAVGWEAYVTCSRCDYTTYVELPVDADAHKWDEGEVQTPATCTEAGERLHTCEHNAEHTKIEVISATGHAYVKNVCSVEGCGHEIPASEIVTLATALANDQTLAGGTYMLTGVVSSDVSYNSTYKNYTFNFVISGTEVEIQAYGTKGEDIDKIGLGDTVTVSGTIKKFGSTLEFDKGYLESYVPGEFEVYLEVFGKGTVSGDFAGIYSRGDEITITVNANDGYKVSKVLVNGQSITSETNEYTFVVKEDTTLEVRFDKEGNNTVVEDVTGTITFDENNSQRVSFSTSQQVWENEGVTFTNSKGGSSSNVADYSNPVRLYKNSSVTIEATNITSITFNCNSASYATALQSSLTENSYTVTVNSKVVTVEFESLVNSFEFVCSAQIRVNSVVVAYQVESTSGSACAHENWSDYVVTTPATCSERGVETATCDDCGETKTRQIPVDPTLHVYDETITTPATCTQPGLKTLTCECGDTKTEEIAATGHSYNSVVTAPTCTADGYTTHTCSVCGDTYKDSETSATGHNYTSVVTAPTCTTGGYTTHTCSVCEDTYKDNETSATGHTEETIPAVAPSCELEGKTEGKKCSVCGEVLVEQSVVPATGHTEVVDEAVEATCTTAGKTEGKHCSVCGEITVAQTVVPATGHSEKAPAKEKVVDATCEADGSYEMNVYCATCGELLSSQKYTTDKLGHDYVSTVTKDPTCTETGVRTYVCTHDNSHTYTEVIEKLSHTPAVAVEENRKEATCTKEGSYDSVVKCSVCGEELSREAKTIDKVAHSSVEIPAVAPTCTETGLTAGTKCSVCGEILVAQEEIAATGHTEVVDAAVAPTCTETGLTEGKHCSVCNEVLVAQTVVDALGHTEVVDAAVDATCTATGLTGGKHCSVCGETLVAQETVAALGHKAETVAGKAPTCTETGLTDGSKCSVCGETLTAQQTIPAVGHTWDVGTETTPATCEEDGVMTYTCTVENCGAEKTETIDKLGHKDEDSNNVCDRCFKSLCIEHSAAEKVVENNVPATCTVNGSYDEVVYCSVCKFELSRETKVHVALGHTEGEVVVENNVDPTCTTAGSYDIVVYCSVCDAELSRNKVTVEALGHTEVVDEAVVPTCTETGLTEGSHCSVCDEVLVAQTVVEAKGHNYEAVVTAPTCTDEGYTTHTCSKCEDSYVDTYVDALDHDLVTAYEVVVVEGVNTLHKVTKCVREGCEHIAEDVTVDTTNSVEVANEADMRTVLQNGFNAKLTGDIDIANGPVEIVDKNTVVYLNGKSIVASGTAYAETTGYNVCGVFLVKGGTLVINGEGRLYSSDAEADSIYVISALDGAVVTINGGDFVSEGSTAVFARYASHVIIKGGTFEAETPYQGVYYTLDTYLDKDSTECTSTINVYGGTFHNFDPANHTNDGTYTNKVMDGYHSIKDGDKYVVSAHTEVVDAAVGATCTATGLTEGKHCSVCGKVLVEQEVTNALGHDEIPHVAQAPTCTEIGWDAYVTCSRCDYTTYAEKEKLGHDYVSGNVVAPTCTADGYTIYNCSRCEATENRDVVDKLGHDLVTAYEVVVVEEVNTLHKVTKCVREGCEHIAEDVTVDTTNSVEVANEADMRTVLENGFNATLTSDITLEGGSIEIAGKTVAVDLNGHNITVTGEKDGVCEAFYVQAGGDLTINGNGTILAKDKGAEHVIALSAVDEAVVTINGGNFVSEGSTAVYATRGAVVNIFGGTYSAVAYYGQMFTIDVNEAEAVLGVINIYGGTFHNFDPANHTNDGTYTNKVMDGYHSIKDGDKYVVSAHTEVVDAAVGATCTATGLTEGKHCSVCGKVLVAQTVVDALGHTEVVDNAVAPTCTETGLTEGKHCSVCGAVLVAQTVVDALGHDEISHVAQAPTCTEAGWEAYVTCSRCDYTTYEAIQATGHTLPEEWTVVTAPTCAEKGSAKRECTSCDYVETKDLDMIAHTPAEAVEENNVDPTCTEAGSYDNVVYCSVCNAELSRTTHTVEKAAHSYESEVTDPTCTAGGYTTHTCSVCGDTYTDNETEAKGHDWSAWEQITGDKHSRTCANDANHVETESCFGGEATCEAKAECSVCKNEYGTLADHKWVTDEVLKAANCFEAGQKTVKCSVCDETDTQVIEKLVHNYVDGTCSYCGAVKKVGVEHVVEFGDNGTGFSDGSEFAESDQTFTAVDGYILAFESYSKAYKNSRDSAGNSCIKLGTSSVAGKIVFEVPDEITTVLVYIAKYKDNVSKVKINETQYTISSSSNDGLFDEIVVDTSNTKIVTITTQSGGYRCLINTIILKGGVSCDHADATGTGHDPTCEEDGYTVYTCDNANCGYSITIVDEGTKLGHDYDSVVTEPTCEDDGYTTHTCSKCGDSYTDSTVKATGHVDEDGDNECDVCSGTICEHTSFNEWVVVTPATCTQAGEKTRKCTNCDYVETDTITALGHDFGELIAKVEATCVNDGKKAYYECSTCHGLFDENKNVTTEADLVIAKTGHNFVDNVCTGCNAKIEKHTYTISEYAAGTQYAENEEHVLDGITTVVTTDCHFTSELRIYSSSTNNGYAVIQTSREILSISVNAGNKADDLIIYGSNDEGTSWVEVGTISVTSTSYKDYTLDLTTSYKWLKIDVVGSNQVRIKSFTLSAIAVDCLHSSGSTKAYDEANHWDVCSACGAAFNSSSHTLPETGTIVENATCTEAGSQTKTCSDGCGYVLTETIEATGHAYVEGVCSICDEKEATSTTTKTETITISGTSGTLGEDSLSISWSLNDVSVVNNKADSSTAIRVSDSAHYRAYAGSTLNLSTTQGKITKIVINCASSSYMGLTAITTGATLSSSGTVYTIVVSGNISDVQLSVSQQTRITSIEFTYEF